MSAKMQQIFSGNINAAAFNTAVLGNRPSTPILEEIENNERALPSFLRNAEQLTQSLKNVTGTLMRGAVGMIEPGMGP